MILTASSASLPADGASTSTIRAALLDQFGAPYRAESPVTFHTDRGTFWGASSVVVPAKDGFAEAVLTSATSAGVAHIQARSGPVPANVNVTFEPGPPHTLDLSAAPLRLYVRETALLEAVVRDAQQNAVSDGTPVRFETTLGTLDTPQATTQGGRAQAGLSSSVPGTARVTASAGQATRSIEIQFFSPLSVTGIAPGGQCNGAPVQVTITNNRWHIKIT